MTSTALSATSASYDAYAFSKPCFEAKSSAVCCEREATARSTAFGHFLRESVKSLAMAPVERTPHEIFLDDSTFCFFGAIL